MSTIVETLERFGHPLTIDGLRRRLRTTKAQIIEAVDTLRNQGVVEYDDETGMVELVGQVSEDEAEEQGSAGVYGRESYEETPDEEFAREQDAQDEAEAREALLERIAEDEAEELGSAKPYVEGSGQLDWDSGVDSMSPASVAAHQEATGGYEAGPNDESELEEEDPAPTFRFPGNKRQEYEAKGGNCGDELAVALTEFLNVNDAETKKLGISEPRMREVMLANGIEEVRGNNPGQRRMNLSNMLRGKLRRGETVRVGDVRLVGETPKPTVKEWKAAWAKSIAEETGCDLRAARLQAEQTLEVHVAGGLVEVRKGRVHTL